MKAARLGAAATLAAALACNPAAAQPRVVRSLLEIRDQGVVRQHLDLTCGAAALATVLTYQFGRPVDERTAVLGLLGRTSPATVRARQGFSLLELKQFAQRQGLFGAGFNDVALSDLDRMAPAIVPLRIHGFRHFVVFRGRQGGRVLVADPAFGNRTLTEAQFNSFWAGRIAFVVFDPAQPHAPNRMGAPAELFMSPNVQALRMVSGL